MLSLRIFCLACQEFGGEARAGERERISIRVRRLGDGPDRAV